MNIYDYTVTDRSGNEVPLKQFEGKVLIIVNTATGCGFTPHYKPLEEMYEKYHNQGLEILDIPCNQFAGQTPGTDEEVHSFCTLKYHTQFDQMHKSDVNGPNALPLYAYLKSCQPFQGFGKGPKALMMSTMLKKIDKDYKNNPDIKWNFTKFAREKSQHALNRPKAWRMSKNTSLRFFENSCCIRHHKPLPGQGKTMPLFQNVPGI